LKDYGVYPTIGDYLDKKNGLDNIALKSKIVGTAHEKFNTHLLSYTPVTTF